jgi:hypothetical protein
MAETDSDASADTARFQAFKDQGDELPPPWQMRASGSKIGILAVMVVAAAILAAIIGSLLVG